MKIKLYIVKVRYSGEDDDVYLANTKEGAEDIIRQYFVDEYDQYEEEQAEGHTDSLTLPFIGWIEESDIGYWFIKLVEHEVPDA